jgi:lipoprotein Spr
LQVKYAVLLNTPAEEVKNPKMFEFIDDWYGTPYRLVVQLKKELIVRHFRNSFLLRFMVLVFQELREKQYNLTNRISRTELKEGDLFSSIPRRYFACCVFIFKTTNLFHASTSGGVMIIDIFDEYWVRRFVGVGRLKIVNQ